MKTEKFKTVNDFTPEEKLSIIARAKEVGNQKTAEEFGTTKWTVRNLRYYSKKPEASADNSTTDKVDKIYTKDSNSSSSSSSINIENALLREKIIVLTEERDKLKAAINMLKRTFANSKYSFRRRILKFYRKL